MGPAIIPKATARERRCSSQEKEDLALAAKHSQSSESHQG